MPIQAQARRYRWHRGLGIAVSKSLHTRIIDSKDRGTQLTPKHEVRSRQNLALQHRAAQGLAHDTQAERDNEQHEEGHGVACSVEDGDDDEEDGRGCAASVGVEVAVIG